MSLFYSRRVAAKFVTVAYVLLLALALTGLGISQEPALVPQDDPVDLFDQGQDEHAKGNFARAIELYDRALKRLPDFAEAEFQKGNAYLSLGKKGEAEGAFRRAVTLKGEWTLALAALGTALERRGEFIESEKLLTKAISIDDSNFPAYSGLVEFRLKTSASPEVLKPLLEKIRAFCLRSNVSSAMFSTRASLENALGDKSAAKQSIARALELDAYNKAALYEKAEIALAEGDLVLAQEMTRTIEKLDAGSEAAILLRARVLLTAGKNDEAKKLLASVPSPSAETVRLAEKVTLASEQSAEVLEKELGKDPKDVVILGRLCSMYRATAPEKALGFCRRALDIEPANINYAIGFGAALLQAKRYDDAITVLRRLGAAAPESATIHANLGTAFFQMKRYEEAKAEYQWLTSHEPVPPVAYYFLAICHDQLSEYLDAGANYNLFLKHADAAQNQLEIDKVKLRLPILDRQIKQQGGRSKSKVGG